MIINISISILEECLVLGGERGIYFRLHPMDTGSHKMFRHNKIVLLKRQDLSQLNQMEVLSIISSQEMIVA